MQFSDVISAPERDATAVADLPAPLDAPELWPVGIWDAVWLIAGVAGADLLLWLT